MPPTSATQRSDSKPRFKYAFMYAHRGEGDTWFQVFSENLRRLRTKRTRKPAARGPIPVIAGSEEAAAVLKDLRLQSIQSEAQKLTRLEIALHRCARGANQGGEEAARLTAEFNNAQERLDAAKLTRVLGPGALKTLDEPENTKLEVVHHGAWGYEYLSTGDGGPSSHFLIAALPAHWKALGLSRKIGSVRLLSCGSGDVAPRRQFISYPRGYHGFPLDTEEIPAQRLADKMKAVGFARPRVTGYQGLGISIPDYLRQASVYVESIWNADVSLPEASFALRSAVQSDGVTTDVVRRSEVAMVFEPTDPDRRRKRLRYEHAYMYAPSGEGDTFEFALEENVRRLAKWIDASTVKPRGPIPLIAPNDEVKKALKAARVKRMRALGEEIEEARQACRTSEQALQSDALSDGEREEVQNALDEQRFIVRERSFYLAAAEATRIEGLDLLTTVGAQQGNEAQRQAIVTRQLANTKIYIPLYGSAGSDVLSTDRSQAPAETRLADISQDLAQHFISEGQAPHVGSFRLLSWESADAKTRRKFEANPSGYSGLFSNRRVAPAQYLANKLEEDGFLRARVTGYQGQGIFWSVSKHFLTGDSASTHPNANERHQGWGSQSIAPVHALQVIPGHCSDWKRRRDVAKVFKPKRGRGLLCL